MIMQKRKAVVRLFWAWNTEKETRWISEMAKKGWLLETVGFMVYRFAKRQPEDLAYDLDFYILRSAEKAEYFGLYRDAGWEHVTSFGNWHYFRSAAATAAKRPVFSDTASRKSMLKRVLTVLLASMLPVAYFGIANPLINGYYHESKIYPVIRVVSALLLAIVCFAVIRIAVKMRKIT